jgi:hypothetical protein
MFNLLVHHATGRLSKVKLLYTRIAALTLSLPNQPFNDERVIKTSRSEPTNTPIIHSVY